MKLAILLCGVTTYNGIAVDVRAPPVVTDIAGNGSGRLKGTRSPGLPWQVLTHAKDHQSAVETFQRAGCNSSGCRKEGPSVSLGAHVLVEVGVHIRGKKVEPMPTQVHSKVPGRGYTRDSPLRAEQERRWEEFDREAAEERARLRRVDGGAESPTPSTSSEDGSEDASETQMEVTTTGAGVGQGTIIQTADEQEEAGPEEGEQETAVDRPRVEPIWPRATRARGSTADPATEAAGKSASDEKSTKNTEDTTKKVEAAEKKAESDDVGRAVAYLIMGALALGSGIFAMTQTSLPHVSNVTIETIDAVLAIFLAVLWFDAVDEILEAVVPPKHHWWLCLLEALVVLGVVLVMAFVLRRKSFVLAAFCGSAVHVCAFMGVHFAMNVQKNHFVLTPLHCAFGFLVMALVFAAIIGLLFVIKKMALHIKVGSDSNDESINAFMDKFDDIENDFMATALAAYWAMVVRFIITNNYPVHGAAKPGQPPPHSYKQRWVILAYSLVVLVLGTVIVHFIPQKPRGYFPGRFVDIFKSFMVASWVMTFMLWAEMTFYEDPVLSLQPVLTRILWAGVVTAVAMVMIVALASGSHKAGARMVLLKSAGMMVGMSWEQTFDASLDSFFDEFDNIHWMKGATALILSALIMPSFVIYFKPYSIKAADAEGG